MTIEQWLEDAKSDAYRRKLPALADLMDGLAKTTVALRAADWNDDADKPGAAGPPSRPEAVTASSRRSSPDSARAEADAIEPVRSTGSSGASRRSGSRAVMPTITQLAPRVAAGSVTAERLTEDALNTIAAHNPRLNAFITVIADEALVAARQADREIAAGRHRGPLHGIPLSIKDLIDVAGLPTTAASKLRDGIVATSDAPIVARLRAAGAVFVGKTNLHEFAFGTTTEDSGWGPARHPVDDSRSPGGSSGGSAIAVATGMSLASIGTDTGGSIRIPAAACGIVGLKPAWGEVAADGVIPLSRQLDHVGPLARSAADAALLFDLLCGRSATPLEALPLSHVRVAMLDGYFLERLGAGVDTAFHGALEAIASGGGHVGTASIPHALDIAPVYLHLVLADAAAYHARTLERRPHAYTPNVRLRLEMGRHVLGEDYARARAGRALLRREIDRALEGMDALVLPALSIEAPPIGAASVPVAGGSEPVRTAMLRCTQPFNLSGHPAISLPCGTTPAGLPVGLQLVGHHGRTSDLLRIADAVERALDAR
jgi:aspartyl-tRNA(Asn)/glutamyl-tRNA(Gln) amidotransferase subunit A